MPTPEEHFAKVPAFPVVIPQAPSVGAADMPTRLVPDYAVENTGLVRPLEPEPTEGNAIQVVSSVGTLRKVQQSSQDTNPGTFPTVLKMVNGTKSITLDSTGIVMTDSATGKSFTISFASLTQNVALRTEAYCDASVNKSMLIPGSAPF